MTKSVLFLVFMKLEGFVFVLLLREGLERYPFFVGLCGRQKRYKQKARPEGARPKKRNYSRNNPS